MLNRNRRVLDLFLASTLALHAELIAIRWLAAEIRVFAYFKNLPLMAAFLGLGLGCARAKTTRLSKMLPILMGAFWIIIAFAGPLRLVHLRFPDESVNLWGTEAPLPLTAGASVLACLMAIFALETAGFAAIGEWIGSLLDTFTPLLGYSINLAGSLVGIALFTVLSVAGSPPIIWIALAALLAVALDRRVWVAVVFAVAIAGVACAPGADCWSPYYRIDFTRIEDPAPSEGGGSAATVGFNLSVDHDYHQRALDLSEAFVRAHPVAATRYSLEWARYYYDLPYVLVPTPGRVLIVGAGTGNDVAAALRHGASHVDAVEIDPTILRLGRKHHPEHPYQSPAVNAIVADARTYFKHAAERYSLIVFGFLDSHTMFSSMSSLRLDNYVYTVESLREAVGLLEPDGILVLTFAVSDRDWIGERLQNTLRLAAHSEPQALLHAYDGGVSFIVGHDVERLCRERLGQMPRWRPKYPSDPPVTPATDDWPFLYIHPGGRFLAYVLVLGSILVFAGMLLASEIGGRARFDRTLFLLGAAFMLVEVKSIATLSLLFGSTWVVNSAVFSGILVMCLCANGLVAWLRPSRANPWYVMLVLTLLLPLFIEVSALGAWSPWWRSTVGTLMSTAPMVFSGIVFAIAFARSPNPSASLASNLIGALVGAVLEYASMGLGIRSLTMLAIAIYGAAWVFDQAKA